MAALKQGSWIIKAGALAATGVRAARKQGSWIIKAVALAATFAIVFGLIQAGVIDSYFEAMIVTMGINIVLATSLNLITGFTGQFSLGHAGFMAVGAYATALTVLKFPTVWGFLLGLVIGGAIAAVIGFLIGLPTLRLRGDYLAIATLGMAEIIRVALLNMPFTNGAAGLFGMPRMINWPWLFVLVVGTVLLIANLLRSVHGRDMIAVREDEIAASSVGVSALRAKTTAFVVGAVFGAVAGGMYSLYFYVIQPAQFTFMKSIDILIIVVLGGLGSLSGTIIAAVLLTVVEAFLTSFPELRMVIYGVILVVIMVFRPQGLMGDRELTLSALRRLIPWRKPVGESA